MHPPALTSLDYLGPFMTPAMAAAFHAFPEPVAWFVLPVPNSNGIIAWAHTVLYDSAHLLRSYLIENHSDELRAIMPPGLHWDTVCLAILPPEYLELCLR